MGAVTLKKFSPPLITTFFIISIAVTLLGAGSAPPILPSSFYGTVMVNSTYVPDGTAISAWIDGIQYAGTSTFTFEGKSVYTIEIPADNPSTGGKDGGEEGDIIDFKIGSEDADLSGTWHTGTNVELNLAASTAPAAPIADFSSSSTTGIVPWIVNFTDLSTGTISSWFWDFGDGGSSTLQNPSYEYSSGGTYTVSLTVTGPGGSDTETKVDYINVTEPAPVANFLATPKSGVAPLAVDFTDLSTGIITAWDWDFGDGGSSTESDPNHQFTTPGVYTVSLTVSGPAGSDSETKVDYIEIVEPGSLVADFIGTPTSGDVPLIVSFTDLSSGDTTSWLWNFGDGASSSDPNPTHEYLTPGIFTVSLQISNSEQIDIEEKQDYVTVDGPTLEYFTIFLPLIDYADE
jgi:PKD repeat protein